jgi:hypothetical protein
MKRSSMWIGLVLVAVGASAFAAQVQFRAIPSKQPRAEIPSTNSIRVASPVVGRTSVATTQSTQITQATQPSQTTQAARQSGSAAKTTSTAGVRTPRTTVTDRASNRRIAGPITLDGARNQGPTPLNSTYTVDKDVQPPSGGLQAVMDAVVLVEDTGWTPLEPTYDTRFVFVDPAGNDASDGRSPLTAVRTLSKGYELLRNGYPDYLLLKAGGVWNGQVLGDIYNQWRKSGKSLDEPMVITSYGAGPRPRIVLERNSPGIYTSNDTGVNFLWIVGLEFDGSVNATRGAAISRLYGGRGFLVEDCFLHNCQYGISVEAVDASGLVQRDITIRRNVIANNYSSGQGHSQGLYMSGADGVLIEENVFDHNGWRSGKLDATIYNHNVYLTASNDNVMFRNNITARASATGAQLRGNRMFGVNNLSLRNPIGLSAGHAQARWPDQAWEGVMAYNVILGATDIQGVGQIGGSSRGFGLTVSRVLGGQVINNIIAHAYEGSQARGLYIENTLAEGGVVSGNIVYSWNGSGGGAALYVERVLSAGEVVKLNHFQQPLQGKAAIVPNEVMSLGGRWDGNTYRGTGGNIDQWIYRENTGTVPFNTYKNSLTRDSGAQAGSVSFPDTNRTIETYMLALGYEPSLERFMFEAGSMSKANWRKQYTAMAVNRWVRDGFGVSQP